MNIKSTRREFPFLKRKFKGQPLAYLDNASTTQKPKVVIDAIVDAYTNHYANIHRGLYDLSVEATNLYESVRAQVRDLISAKSEKEIIFTRNATEAINLVAYCLENQLFGGDPPRVDKRTRVEAGEILLTQMEHHSNIVPWQMLAERLTKAKGLKTNLPAGKAGAKCQIKIKYLPIDDEGRLELGRLDKLMTKRTKIVSLTLMSNVLGTINPVKKIIRRVRELSTVYRQQAPMVLVDAAQAAAHMRIDVGDLDCDFLVFSAHKMYGPTGVGVLWGKKELLETLPPFLGGGDMILAVSFEKTIFNELPWKFEAGTPSIADVIAFGEAITFINKVGFGKINRYEMELTKYSFAKLSNDPIIQLFGPKNLIDRGPVVSFNVDGVHPHDVASILSEEAVAIRSGHHCAQPLMGVLGIDAVCRASFGIYNTEQEVDRLIRGIEKVKKVFKLNFNQKVRRRSSKGNEAGIVSRFT